jgi:hypothetical protein
MTLCPSDRTVHSASFSLPHVHIMLLDMKIIKLWHWEHILVNEEIFYIVQRQSLGGGGL